MQIQVDANESKDIAIQKLKQIVKDREDTLLQIQHTKAQVKNQLSQTTQDHELHYKQELLKANKIHDMMTSEIAQLREAFQRCQQEQFRLIDDKRELEDLIEKLN